MKIKVILILVAFMGAGTSVYSQGNTTSSINGVVSDNGGKLWEHQFWLLT
jgi:hypothetical protein